MGYPHITVTGVTPDCQSITSFILHKNEQKYLPKFFTNDVAPVSIYRLINTRNFAVSINYLAL